MSQQITVWQNDIAVNISADSSLQQLLSELLERQQALAVAVNAQVIPRQDWPQYRLRDQDKISIFQAIAGG